MAGCRSKRTEILDLWILPVVKHTGIFGLIAFNVIFGDNFVAVVSKLTFWSLKDTSKTYKGVQLSQNAH